MPQIFHPSMNTISRVSIFGFVFFVALAGAVGWLLARSPYQTGQRVVVPQPIPFSHEHHVGDIGIDCRFCHDTVESQATAGMPSTEVCLNCHSVLFRDSEMLAEVHTSMESGVPIAWTRVHNLADYAYFHHGVHVKAGIGCSTCHGEVDEMPLMFRTETLHMEWCLDCHRDPEKYVRPRDRVFDMEWEPGGLSHAEAAELVDAHDLQNRTQCSYCHR
jgi:hypothetical protein